jgi:hypothetical protein
VSAYVGDDVGVGVGVGVVVIVGVVVVGVIVDVAFVPIVLGAERTKSSAPIPTDATADPRAANQGYRTVWSGVRQPKAKHLWVEV